MAESNETVQEIEIASDKITKLRVFITDRRIHYLAKSAVKTMHMGVSMYWNKHYNLRAGQTRTLALFQGGGNLEFQIAKRKVKRMNVLEPSPNSTNFRSRNGNKRLVSFTFGRPNERANFQSSNVTIHSFPMNLYERDVMLGGWASGTLRKGTHIMKALRGVADTNLSATTQELLADVDRRWKEMGGN